MSILRLLHPFTVLIIKAQLSPFRIKVDTITVLLLSNMSELLATVRRFEVRPFFCRVDVMLF